MRRLLLLGLALLTLGGCFHSAIGMTPSTKPLAPGGYEELGPAKGVDCLWLLFGVLPVSTGNTLQGATKQAIRDRKGADALIQVTADSFFQHYILVARSCTQVEGIAVRSQ
ncbi:MAG: hypothetical protein P1V51_15485 [Deltaproteobacteria bacterium]|nr:hypothetical protein [Deltaproteobacteria bacterium]